MRRIFFFQKRNPTTGELMEDYIDTDERTAYVYLRNTRHYQYVGWSDGRFMAAVQTVGTKNKDTGMMLPADEKVKQGIREAQAAELKFAKENPDKRPPRVLEKFGIDGNPMTDPNIINVLGR